MRGLSRDDESVYAQPYAKVCEGDFGINYFMTPLKRSRTVSLNRRCALEPLLMHETRSWTQIMFRNMAKLLHWNDPRQARDTSAGYGIKFVEDYK